MELKNELTMLNGIGELIKGKLRSAGITTVSQLATLSPNELSNIKGFGPATSKKFIEAAQEYMENNGNSVDKSSIEPTVQEKCKSASYEGYEIVHDRDNNLLLEKSSDNPLRDETDFIIDEIQEEQIPYAKNIEEVYSRECRTVNNSQKLDNFIPNDSVLEPMKSSIPNEIQQVTNSIITREEDILYKGLNNEKLTKKELTYIRADIVRKFRALGYGVADNNSSLLRKFSKILDLMVYKVLEINHRIGILYIIPMKIIRLRGTLVVYDEIYKYNPAHSKVDLGRKVFDAFLHTPIENLKESQQKIFQNIIQGKKLYALFKKLMKGKMSIIKTRNNKSLYIASGQKQYKVIVDPVLISSSEPAFVEKSIIFPYQRSVNMHVINSEMLSTLVQFLENKYQSLESLSDQNAKMKHQNFTNKTYMDITRYSIPFLVYGILVVLILISQNIFLLSTFVSLGYAAIGIYVVILVFYYLRFNTIQRELNEDYNTPYYQKEIQLDETDLLVMKEEMAIDWLEQFIFECFGKNCKYPSLMTKVEQEKSIKAEKATKTHGSGVPWHNEENDPKDDEDNIESQENLVREKLISKYSKFLED